MRSLQASLRRQSRRTPRSIRALKSPGRHWPLVILLILYLLLGYFYLVKSPFSSKPDEGWHLGYVEHLKRNRSLPVVRLERMGIGERERFEPEGHQPPFYYALVALLSWKDDMSDAEKLYRPNPHFLSTEKGNKNPLAPSRSRSEATLLIGRYLSLFFGAIAVTATYFMACEFLPQNIALMAATLVALNPQFLFISTSLSNDISVVALITAGLWQGIRVLKTGLTPRRAMLLGVITGFATLFKLSGFLLIIVVFLLGLKEAWRKGGKAFGGIIPAVALSVAIPAPWFWRNWKLYGDALATNVVFALMGQRPEPIPWARFKALLLFIWKAYWVDFSAGGIVFAQKWVYLLLALFVVLALIGAVIAFIRRREIRLYLGLCFVWTVLVTSSFLSLTCRTEMFMGGGRLLFPAISAISIVLAVGVDELIPRKRKDVLPLLFSSLWIAFAVFALGRYLMPEYPIPPTHSSERALTIPNHTFINLEDKVAIIGYEINRSEAKAGETVGVTIFWKTLGVIDENYSVFVAFVPAVERIAEGLASFHIPITQIDTYPGMGIYPTSRWREGEVIEETYVLRVPRKLPGPVNCRIIAGMYYYPTVTLLETWDAQGNDLDTATLGHIALRPRKPLEVPSEVKLPEAIAFGSNLFLVGKKVGEADRGLRVVLWWRSQGSVEKDFTVFVHLRDENGEVVAQGDGPPMHNGFSTSLWKAGDVIPDEHEVVLPKGVLEGDHFISVGLYDLKTMERLPAFDQDGRRLPDDAYTSQITF